MTGDPADVGGTPVDVARMVVEHVFKSRGRIDQVAASGVQHAFWLTGGTGGIQDEQRIFGVHLFRLVFRAGFLNQIAPPQVAPFLPVDFAAGTLEHHHVFDTFDVRILQRVIDILLQRDRATGAQPFISGDHQAGV